MNLQPGWHGSCINYIKMSYEQESLKYASWGNIMKRNRKVKVQDNSQTSYVKFLNSLRNAVTADYSKAVQKEKRAVILAYD
jgi:hypothetical protein